MQGFQKVNNQYILKKTAYSSICLGVFYIYRDKVYVIGAGLAGSEAAWQLAQRGVKTALYEMRPVKMTPAHQSGYFGELVCSNSLRAASLNNAVGLLKEEMRRCSSLIMEAADKTKLPAGGALAVDREEFARHISRSLKNHPLLEFHNREVTELLPERPLIIATGPLTSDALSVKLEQLTGSGHLYFFDAAAPIVSYESINTGKAFFASRYGKGGADYLNCPMDEEEYNRFVDELIRGEVYTGKEFEKETFFEGCMPVEEMARRGKDTLRFGPLKPVGITKPGNGQRPHAVVQLRKDNQEGTLYNMVGFQTRLKHPEQKRIFRLIPGLEDAEFVRYGGMHRNTFINAPTVLKPTLEMIRNEGVFMAGQITGVEGYVESSASGIIAGLNAFCYLTTQKLLVFPPDTAMGALTKYISSADPNIFQPMNVNYGLFPPLQEKAPKKKKRELYAHRSLESLSRFLDEHNNLFSFKA